MFTVPLEANYDTISTKKSDGIWVINSWIKNSKLYNSEQVRIGRVIGIHD